MTQDDTPPPPEAYVNEQTTAHMLQVSVRTLQRYRSAGTGPKWSRIGPRMIRYLRTDLTAWLAAARQ